MYVGALKILSALENLFAFNISQKNNSNSNEYDHISIRIEQQEKQLTSGGEPADYFTWKIV